MEYTKNKYGNKLRVHTCCECGTKWTAESGGEGRRTGGRCDTCYPLYRCAVNLFYSSKKRADTKGIPHDLTLEYIHNKIKQPCERTGQIFKGGGSDYSNRNPLTASIDKIDPSKGYTKDNVQFVIWQYNLSKSAYTDEELLDFCKRVIKYHTDHAPRVETEQHTVPIVTDTDTATNVVTEQKEKAPSKKCNTRRPPR